MRKGSGERAVCARKRVQKGRTLGTAPLAWTCLSLHPVPVWAEVSWGNGLGAPPSWTCKRYTQGAQAGGQAEQ